MSWILFPSDFSHLPAGLQSSGRLIPASPSPAQCSAISLHPCRGCPSATEQIKSVGLLILTQHLIIYSVQTTSWPWCSFSLKQISLKFHLLQTHNITLAAQRDFKMSHHVIHSSFTVTEEHKVDWVQTRSQPNDIYHWFHQSRIWPNLPFIEWSVKPNPVVLETRC